MKNANEFIERYNSDEEFRNEVKAKTQALKGSGAENPRLDAIRECCSL